MVKFKVYEMGFGYYLFRHSIEDILNTGQKMFNKVLLTRQGREIFYFLCKHFFFEIKYMGVLLVNKTKNFADFWWRQIFENLIIHKPSLGSSDDPQKFGPDRFSRFEVYWIQTERQAKSRCLISWSTIKKMLIPKLIHIFICFLFVIKTIILI